jgi:hypothetical protein
LLRRCAFTLMNKVAHIDAVRVRCASVFHAKPF